MKQWINALLVSAMLVSLAACGNSKNTASQWGSQVNVSATEQESEQLGLPQQTATIEETVLVDDQGIRITATELDYTGYSVELKLMIENNSGMDLSFTSGSMGYSCNSVNGYMVEDGYLYCNVANGKKVNDSISFGYQSLLLYGINEVADIEVGFDISDDNFNHVYTGPRQVRTSAFDNYDYERDSYQETITSQAAQNTYQYELSDFSTEEVYNQDGIRVTSVGVMHNQEGDDLLLIEAVNQSSEDVCLSVGDIVLNRLKVHDSAWSISTVNSGKRAILNIDLSAVMDDAHRAAFGINGIGSIQFTLSRVDRNGAALANPVKVTISIPGQKDTYDPDGLEVYAQNGVRVVVKDIVKDDSEYDNDIYVLLMVENNSGEKISVNNVYDSLSVNGYMTDYSFYGGEVTDGECAMLEVKIWESSLEDNGITTPDDITELEVSFELKAGRTVIGKPVVSLVRK